MELIKGRTIPEVWLKAAQYVDGCPHHEVSVVRTFGADRGVN